MVRIAYSKWLGSHSKPIPHKGIRIKVMLVLKIDFVGKTEKPRSGNIAEGKILNPLIAPRASQPLERICPQGRGRDAARFTSGLGCPVGKPSTKVRSAG
jgi:hypothetical protein